MPTTITLPESLEAQLQQQATARAQSIEEIALALLRDAVASLPPPPSLSEVVACIKATPPAPDSIRPAQGSLQDALRALPLYPSGAPQDWDTAWVEVDAELRAMTHADELREGRDV